MNLTQQDLLEMYHQMVLTRALGDMLFTLARQGRILYGVSANGHEAAQIGSAWALRRGEDYVYPYYRDIGVVLSWGMTARDLMAQAFRKATDPSSRGRQHPAHFGCRRLNIVSSSSVVATQIPQAAGTALGLKLREEDGIVIVYFGDGATSKGDFHEGLNFAAIHQAPVIFLCENNRYAISVPQTKQMAVEDIASRAAGYGFPGVVVDGNDVLAVYEATRAAVERARQGDGPTLIEAKTYRLHPHAAADPDFTADPPYRYREPEEVEEWKSPARDPIARFEAYLKERGFLDSAGKDEIHHSVQREIENAIDFAVESPEPAPEGTLAHVYFEAEC
jgi:2-oxoisovalerate dehydrogenase E1 component alpha subunit